AEVLQVQVAHRQHFWRRRQLGAEFGPKLRPAVKATAQKRKNRLTHLLVLGVKVVVDDDDLSTQPLLETFGSFVKVHGVLENCIKAGDQISQTNQQNRARQLLLAKSPPRLRVEWRGARRRRAEDEGSREVPA